MKKSARPKRDGRAKQITQEQVAKRLGGRQVYVSRLERRADMRLSTLREYVKAIGGQLQLVVTFPRAGAVKLKDIGAHTVPGADSQRREAKRKGAPKR